MSQHERDGDDRSPAGVSRRGFLGSVGTSAIGVAAALQSNTCTLMWAKQARKAGVTTAEIVEAIVAAPGIEQAAGPPAPDGGQYLMPDMAE